MFRIKNKLLFCVVSSIFLFNSVIFAQIVEENQLPEELNILEEFEKKSKPLFDKDLQKEFVVLENVIQHEFNPQLTSISADNDILCNVYEGLFTAHPITLDPQYAIATGYKVSRDKKRWIITLNEKAAFSDGTPITADDVKYSWMTLLATPNAPYASLLDIIRGAAEYRNGTGSAEDVGIYVNGKNSISVYLKSPVNYLPRVLCHTAFSIISKKDGVYSGAYYIDEITEDKTILKKNPYYWDSLNVAIEKVIFQQIDDAEERTYLFNTGKADWAMGNVLVDKILDQNAIQLEPSFGISFYFFKQSVCNPAKKETGSVWDHAEFRNAVLEALPWDKLRENNFVPATTFVYPLAGYPHVDGFDFTDPIEAKLKMKDARKKYNVSEDEILTLTVDIVKESLSKDSMDAVIEALAPIGVEVIFREIHPALYFQNISESDADIFTYSWIGDFADPLTFLELFRGDSSFNESGWQNDEFDALLDLASFVGDEERFKHLAKAENILLNDGMIIPIARTVSLNIIDPKEVGGWYPNAFDQHMFKFIYKKKVKTTLPNVVMK